jgi:hypothetical protein
LKYVQKFERNGDTIKRKKEKLENKKQSITNVNMEVVLAFAVRDF